MPNISTAEWFLSFFTTPDRAAAIFGDLSEQRCGSRSSVFRTAGSLFVHTAAAQPLHLSMVVLLGLILRHIAVQVNSVLWRFFVGGLGYALSAAIWTCVMAPTLMGYVMARLARGREVPGCLALSIVHSLLIGSFVYEVFERLNTRSPLPAWSWEFLSFAALTIVFIGLMPSFVFLTVAAITRRRTLTRFRAL